MNPQTKPRPTPYDIAAQTDAYLRELAREEVLVSRMVGKALVRLATLDGFAALGYSSLASYAGQQLGLSGHAAQEQAWMERRLQRYPAIDAGYDAGRLSFSHARALLRAVKPEDELLWAEVAARLSVAELEQAIEDWKERGLAPACQDETAGTMPIHAPEDAPKSHLIRHFSTPAQVIKLELAVELVRRDQGADLSVGACLEFMMAEFLTGVGFAAQAALADEDESDEVPGEVLPWRVPGIGKIRRLWREIELGLAEFTRHWDYLSWAVPSKARPLDVSSLLEPADIDRHLRAMVGRDREREKHLALLLAKMRDHRLHEILDFNSIGQYVADRLMFSPRSAWTLLAVERRTRALPALWDAYGGGLLTKAQVLLVAEVAREETQSAWIDHARHTTLKFLREDMKAAERLRVLDPEAFERTGGVPETVRAADAEPGHVQACAGKAGGGLLERAESAEPGRVQACAGDAGGGLQERPESAEPGRVQACGEGARPERTQACAATDFEGGSAGDADADDAGDACEWGRVPGCASESEDLIRAAEVARLPMAKRLRMYHRGDIDEIEDVRRTRHTFHLPHALVETWRDVVRACRQIYGSMASIADCIEACVDAYLQEHGRWAMESIRRHRVLDRDGWRCANPTCPRRSNLHDHHLKFRSRGGGSEPENRLTLCEFCHQRLVHGGRARVHGKAPDAIVWELGIAPGRGPHLEVMGRRIVGGTAVAGRGAGDSEEAVA